MNKKPHNDRSSRAQRRRDERAVAKAPPAPPAGGQQQLSADKLFNRIGQLDFSIIQLQEENASLRGQMALQQQTIDMLTAQLEPQDPQEEVPATTPVLEEVFKPVADAEPEEPIYTPEEEAAMRREEEPS